MQSCKQLQKGHCGDTVEGYPEPALQQKTEGGGGSLCTMEPLSVVNEEFIFSSFPSPLLSIYSLSYVVRSTRSSARLYNRW